MKPYGPEQIHTVGVFGHGGCGKTTLVEALLYTAKATTRLGRVEDGNTVTDYDPDEKERRQSIHLAIAPLEWKDNKINLIDVPGSADYASEVAAAMRVIDGAIIVLDASAGVEVGTELVWQQAKAANVPVMLFVNKMDRENADFERTVQQAQTILDNAVVPLQLPIGKERDFRGIISLRRQRAWLISPKHDGSFEEADIPAEYVAREQELREALIDKVAVTNDHLIEKYLEGGADALTLDEIRDGLRAGIANNTIVPVFVGSATQLAGMAQLLDGILDCIPSAARKIANATDLQSGQPIQIAPTRDAPLAALVFKTLVDPHVGKLSYVRVYGGVLRANSVVLNSRTRKEERIGPLYQLRGKEQTAVPEIGPGDLGAVIKLVETVSGDTLCAPERPVQLRGIQYPAPAFTGVVRPHSRADQDKMSAALQRVAEEDPALQIGRDPITGDTLLSGLSETHLQNIAERMKRKFGVAIDIELPRVPYRETIRSSATTTYIHKKQTGGAGQYANVSMRLEPLPPDPKREDPLEFVWEIVGGVISRGFAPAIEKGVREAMQEGVLSGSPVVDVRVAIYDGKEHPVDSKEIAFKTAALMAFKQAMAKANPVIMEPIYELQINVPDQFTGDIMSDLNTRRGRILGIQNEGTRTTITAHVPLAECQRYATDLRSLTQGRGTFSMRFDHYEEVPAHLAEQIKEQAQAAHQEA
ncbi:elongation factor G [Kallotenue papyrolyticum]|uniref:elongation factor G n=1 Tax=Kallotenue papyrolyticum TaxID=1325125 RepID=UPI000492DD34|nr:elongation factor G [Kallotenue papyrolyticum]